MNYNQPTLIGLGLFGVLLHCLIQLHKQNKETQGKAKLLDYLKLEIYSILISISMAVGSSFVGNEIEAVLEKIGYSWLLGLCFITIGYMGQSLLIAFMGKASKVIGNTSPPTDEPTI